MRKAHQKAPLARPRPGSLKNGLHGIRQIAKARLRIRLAASKEDSPLFSTTIFNWKSCFLLSASSRKSLMNRRAFLRSTVISISLSLISCFPSLLWVQLCQVEAVWKFQVGTHCNEQFTNFETNFEVKIIGHRRILLNAVQHTPFVQWITLDSHRSNREIESDSSHNFTGMLVSTETCKCFFTVLLLQFLDCLLHPTSESNLSELVISI